MDKFVECAIQACSLKGVHRVMVQLVEPLGVQRFTVCRQHWNRMQRGDLGSEGTLALRLTAIAEDAEIEREENPHGDATDSN